MEDSKTIRLTKLGFAQLPKQSKKTASFAGLTSNKTQFLSYVHSFRAIAIIAVVGTHVLGDIVWRSDSVIAQRIITSLVQNATILFVLVSGFLFQHTAGHFRYGEYLIRKFKNVITPYLIVSIPDTIIDFIFHHGIYAPDYLHRLANPILTTAYAYLTGAEMPIPLWFIPMIAVFYLLAPILLLLDRHSRAYWIVPPLIITAMFVHRPVELSNTLHSACYCFPAYLLGMWVSHYKEDALILLAKARLVLVTLAVALVVLEVAILKHSGSIFSQRMFSTENGLLDIDLPLKLFLSFVLLDFLSRYDDFFKDKLRALAGASFGIFFLHEYLVLTIRFITQRFGLTAFHGGLLLFLFLWAAIVAATFLLVLGIRRIFGKYSKILIGC
jgi:surface polysaccharide O-acyltransferase-like enzyme